MRIRGKTVLSGVVSVVVSVAITTLAVLMLMRAELTRQAHDYPEVFTNGCRSYRAGPSVGVRRARILAEFACARLWSRSCNRSRHPHQGTGGLLP